MIIVAVQVALMIVAAALFAGILIVSPRPNIVGALMIVMPLYWLATIAAAFALLSPQP